MAANYYVECTAFPNTATCNAALPQYSLFSRLMSDYEVTLVNDNSKLVALVAYLLNEN